MWENKFHAHTCIEKIDQLSMHGISWSVSEIACNTRFNNISS
jgi:hypothetical protein